MQVTLVFCLPRQSAPNHNDIVDMLLLRSFRLTWEICLEEGKVALDIIRPSGHRIIIPNSPRLDQFSGINPAGMVLISSPWRHDVFFGRPRPVNPVRIKEFES